VRVADQQQPAREQAGDQRRDQDGGLGEIGLPGVGAEGQVADQQRDREADP
jgi:hypothetical protein